MPTKGKYVTKKENPSSLGPVRTTIVQIPTPEQNMLRNKTISQKKKTFLLLDLVRPNNDLYANPKKGSREDFFSWPIQRRHEAEE